MPRSINCFHAGEAPGWLLSFNGSMMLFGNIWIWGTEWKVCIWGKHLEKETASRCVWAKMLFKCKLNIRSCPALQAFRKHLIAGESAVLAAARGWRSGCRTVSADVRVHSLQVAVQFVVGESVTLFSLVQAKLFNSSSISSRCGITKAKLCSTEEQTGWFLVAVLHVCNY